MTTEDTQQLNTANVVAPKKRVWEVDALRGLLIILVSIDHFMWDSAYMFHFSSAAGEALKNFARACMLGTNFFGQVRDVIHDSCVMMFIFISGLSCAFSRNNFLRGAKMAGVAVGFTLITYLGDVWLKLGVGVVAFNVIHVLTLCVFFWAALDFVAGLIKNVKIKNAYYFLVAAICVVCIVVGYYFEKYPLTESGLPFLASIWFNNNSLMHYSSGDYLFFLPEFGWFLLGALISKLIYSKKTSLFPSVNEKVFCPLTFCGRYCLWVYFGAQLFYVALGGVFGWL